jgi:ribose/xylose/arabinose/galactoside ABC-type transport system permease subunit
MDRQALIRLSAGRLFQRFSLAVMIVLLIILFTALNDNFLTLSNFQNILEQNAALAIVAVGVTFAVISRALDLSPGSAIALSGVVIGLVHRATGEISLALAAGLATNMLIGLFNGFLVAKIELNPVIVTLAAYIWARGLALALTEKDSIVIQSPLVGFMNTRLFGLISPPMILILLAYLLGHFLLTKTRLGRYTYALGGDELATKEAGVRTDLYKIGIFITSGFLVGIASIVTMARMGAAEPNAVFGLELDAIVAAIIGGNKLSGGAGGVKQTLLGVFFLALLNNGLSTLGLRDAYFYFYKGLVILFALFVEVTSRRMLAGAAPGPAQPHPVPGGQA